MYDNSGLPIIKIFEQDIKEEIEKNKEKNVEEEIELHEIQIHSDEHKSKQCCTLFQWSGKHQMCCRHHPHQRRKTAEISNIWIYFVILMLFLCLFFVIFLSVIKGF